MGRRMRIGAVTMVLGLISASARGGELKAGAASKRLEANDEMVVGGSIGPVRLKGQEGELRASALVVEGPDGGKACLVACDVLMIERDVLDDAARRIAARTGIPYASILINATQTHHAPTTASIPGYEREVRLCFLSRNGRFFTRGPGSS